MKIQELPDTTLKLLKAARMASGTTKGSKIDRVIIRSEGGNCGIHYMPAKTRYTSAAVEKSGIGELVTLFSFEMTRHKVARHFRPGIYDISENEIKIIK